MRWVDFDEQAVQPFVKQAAVQDAVRPVAKQFVAEGGAAEVQTVEKIVNAPPDTGWIVDRVAGEPVAVELIASQAETHSHIDFRTQIEQLIPRMSLDTVCNKLKWFSDKLEESKADGIWIDSNTLWHECLSKEYDKRVRARGTLKQKEKRRGR